MKQRQHDFVAAGHWFGRKRFTFSSDTGAYYVPYILAAGLGIGLMIVFAITMAVVVPSKGSKPDPAAISGVLAMFAVFYLAMFAVMVFLRVKYTNLLWNNTKVGAHRFDSRLRARDMMWIYASNLVAIVCTLGLAVPWAMIRLARYRAEHFSMVTTGSIEDFLVDAEGEHGAAGAELVDALDVGADFGF